jgi:NitT/TauT family transport system ATP-binding protein
VTALVRAHRRAAAFIEDPANRDEVTAILAAPDRIGVAGEVIRRALDGRIKIAPDGSVRASDRYLLIGRKDAARPDTVQAAWLYAQMVRWAQAPLSPEMLAAAKAVFRPDLFDAALADAASDLAGEPADGIGAFAGPPFDADDITGYLAAWNSKPSADS